MNSVKPLQFRNDGTFTIVQFTDVHWQGGEEKDRQTRLVMEQVLDAEKPDFVMFTGDTIYACRNKEGRPTCEDPRRSLREAVDAVVQREIPWALVFGNHDTEYGITREELMQEVLKQPFNCTEAGPEHIDGIGNYVLPIQSATRDETAALLYGIDSGDYSRHPEVEGYAWIRQSQIQWYIEQSNAWREQQAGKVLPALAFFHIPLPEYKRMWKRSVCYGQKNEKVCASRMQSGFFAALIEQGDVMATFCGHDHINDFWGEYYGIGLYYGRATGYNTYGKEGMLRGARVIRLTEGERKFESWLRLADGSVIKQQPEHLPEQR